MGRATCAYAQESGFEVKGFLDEKVDAIAGFCNYPPILDSAEEYEVCDDDLFVVALGESDYRRKYAEMIVAKGGKFVSVVHPTASVGKNAKIGLDRQVFIGISASLIPDVTLGDGVYVAAGTVVTKLFESGCPFGVLAVIQD